MNDAHQPDPTPPPITTKQVVIGAAVVLLTVLALTLYSAREEEPSAAERARREVIESVVDACRRYDKPGETELDDACESLLGVDSPL
jgi:hypothetical protein